MMMYGLANPKFVPSFMEQLFVIVTLLGRAQVARSVTESKVTINKNVVHDHVTIRII